MTSFTTPVYLQSITQFFMNYIWHLICATSISFGSSSIPPPHMSATWPRYIRWLQTSKNPIFRQHAPVPEPEVNEPNEPSSRKAQQQKIQKLPQKSQFCCEHQTIVEDWRGMVVVNWMMFFFLHMFQWCAWSVQDGTYFGMWSPEGEKKVRHTMMYHQNFYTWPWTYGGIRAGIPFGNFDSHLGIPWDSQVRIRANTFHGWPSAKVNHDPSGPLTHREKPTSWMLNCGSDFFQFAVFLTLLGFGSIRSLSMRCTWNSLINLENKNKDSESESFFRKKC